MAVPTRHVLQQAPVLATLVRTAVSAARSRGQRPSAISTPGPIQRAELRPRPAALVRDYVRHVGGDPDAYRGVVPAHLFPQWGFPLLAASLRTLGYDLTRVVNGGCRLTLNAPLPAGERLEVTEQLVDVNDDGRRALIEQELVTSTASSPRALVARTFTYVPLSRGTGDKKKSSGSRGRARVPSDARPIARYRLSREAGLEFAVLTGDFNPVHWVQPFARASGFRGTILHGYATLARTLEAMNRAVLSRDPNRLAEIEVRFTRPLVLPAQVGVFLGSDHTVFVGDAAGGPAYMTGRYTLRARED